eukprot:TRINITY_DN1682_c1_g1_i1.p1 TRINITY_DN1682_c1_g1~~TRINITY_DN1682_c1_g1_i1.p1  ORF type:complete len:506 (+),score=215.65 TRINITY_DN1682_c1_g1_i1:1-1518(+)
MGMGMSMPMMGMGMSMPMMGMGMSMPGMLGALVTVKSGSLARINRPPPQQPTGPVFYTVDELKEENEILKDSNDDIDLECERLQLSNDVLLARVRQKERETNKSHARAVDDLTYCKSFINHEISKQRMEEEERQRQLEEEQRRLREEQEFQRKLAAMTPDQRREYDEEQRRLKDERERREREERDERERQRRMEQEARAAHEKRIREWCGKQGVETESIIQQIIDLDDETAMQVMRGNIVGATDKDSVVLSRIRKHMKPEQVKAQKKKAEDAEREEAEKEVSSIQPGVLCNDPAQSNDALLRLYVGVFSLARPGTVYVYENFLTKATMILPNPDGDEVETTVRVPGRDPDRQMMRELICGEIMGSVYPGKSREDILCELERMKHMREILKKEKMRKPETRPGMQAALLAATSALQITAGPQALALPANQAAIALAASSASGQKDAVKAVLALQQKNALGMAAAAAPLPSNQVSTKGYERDRRDRRSRSRDRRRDRSRDRDRDRRR